MVIPSIRCNFVQLFLEMRIVVLTVIICFLATWGAFAQDGPSSRSSFFLTYGTAGANLREFNEMLRNKGLSPMRNGYTTLGIGYQSRINDFIFGVEVYQNSGPRSVFRDYELDYRTSRFYFNVGYALTEEGKIQFIHYMSLGMGYMDFQMVKEETPERIQEFLSQPAQGFILRKNNIHKGTHYFGGFLTEIGFQFSYDMQVPNMEEAVELIGKFGYSFSPFENAWSRNGIAFDNIQSGPFLRMGLGISLPDRNVFYNDATMGLHFFYGKNMVNADPLNERLNAAGYRELPQSRGNIGLKIIGENGRKMYGIDIFNLSNKGRANEVYSHTLNSVRVYANYGYQLYKRNNLELGIFAGLGYGNLRYTLDHSGKPDFPLLFEEPDFDGALRTSGLMAKPELMLAYALPVSKIRFISMVYSVHAGYEAPLGSFELADLKMTNFMKGPYLQFGVGFRP